MMLNEYKHLFRQVMPHEMELFNHEWKKICEEKGATYYEYHKNSDRFFILEGDKIVGTVEFTKRSPAEFSVCEDYFDFENHPLVSKNHKEVVEVGKIGIKEEHRSEGHVDKILLLLCVYAQLHNTKQYIAYMNLQFYRLIAIVYGFQLKRLSKAVKFETHTSLPVLCEDIEKAIRILNKKKKIALPSLEKI